MSDTSGQLFEMPFAFCDPELSCLRTSEGISRWGSTLYSLTLPVSGSMRNGACFDHPMSERHTNVPASLSLLPTPTASQPGGTPEQHLQRKRGGKMNRTNPTVTDLRMAIELLPTPTANGHDSRNSTVNRTKHNPTLVIADTLSDVAWKIGGGDTPTPLTGGNESPDIEHLTLW